MRVGHIEVLPLNDFTIHISPRGSFTRPSAVGDPWDCHEGILDADGLHEFAHGGFLVRTGERVVIVDAGLGPDGDGIHVGTGFLDSLKAHGVSPDDVTDVLFTHLHLDHVGWSTRNGEITFPNATFRVHSADWSHFVERPMVQGADSPYAARIMEKMIPLSDRMELFDSTVALAPGVEARPVPGHTPGSSIFVVADQGERALLLGDAVHSVVELLESGWEYEYDLDKKAASAVRDAIARELEDGRTAAAGAHFPGLEFGRLRPVGGRRVWQVL